MFLRSYFLCFTQFGGSSYCLNFDKFRNTAPLKSKLQPWSKRLGTPKEMRRENTPCLLKSYLTCYKCLGMLLKEPVSAVPPPLSNVGCVEKAITSTLNRGGRGGEEKKCVIFTSCCVNVARVLTRVVAVGEPTGYPVAWSRISNGVHRKNRKVGAKFEPGPP